MNYIWHIVSIPNAWVEYMGKVLTYSKNDFEKYMKTKEYVFGKTTRPVMRGEFSSQELAFDTIQKYGHNIYEYYYLWVVVEQHHLNCIDRFSSTGHESWFKWNVKNGRYEEASKPKYIKHIFDFARPLFN